MTVLDVAYKNQTRFGGPASPLMSDHRALQVANRQLDLYEATKEGRVFHGNTAAAGNVLPIFSNTTQEMGLWNSSTTVNAVLTRVALTYVSTTGAAGGFVLGYNTGAGAALGGTITAITSTTPTNGLVGAGRTSQCTFTGAAATVTAPTIYRHIGLNQLVITATDATNTQWTAIADFPGDIIIPPGSAVWVAGNIATLIIMAGTMTWVEEDL